MSLPPCPKCNSNFIYQDQSLLICPECAHEWNPSELLDEEEAFTVKDFNGTLLNEGDKVTMIKDLKIKSSSQVLKVGTKAVIRRIVEGKDHQLDCKVDGAGEMMVTAKFVKRA
ncbi:zinc ribbon domain-containing protein YjdM [Colwellia psychrerythraea]|uniref:Alkylphosphonate utilization operon protein PhnA n=1 Tax=Colwellia psychrerythraea TaxID=28229 RepID=A0A099KM78_COLPS|nr:zinc ribbon domain-containing protein YjdM [Colwellia psychrerythraea]KGJ91556.1 alkylphosphonate utilization operon protein PhnA [Colwellia psychrerythraea]